MPNHELPELNVRITADTSKLDKGVNAATGKLEGLRTKVQETERAFIKYGAAAGVAAASMASLKLVSVTREFNKLNAGLITATGSAKGAEQAFKAIQDFAATTPFSLQQATEGFTKLVNLGLNPSEAALRSYGNTATAMGKDLNQMIEAVADAATGEFERLKEFGIKAKSEGDKVSFTFQGVTTQIGKNAEEIENYLKAIGENQFAGAMQQRVDTLDGALSNLEDAWNQLFLTVSQEGIGDQIKDGVRAATAAIEELQNMIKSGQLEAQIKAIGGSFDGIVQDVLNMTEIAEGAFYALSAGSNMSSTDIVAAFKNMPENIRAFIQIITVEMASLLDKLGAWGEEAADAVKFWDGDSFDIESRLKAIDQARLESIGVILKEKDAAVASVDEQLSKADELRAQYNQMEQERKKLSEDRLAGFELQKEQNLDEIFAEFDKDEKITQKHLEELDKRVAAEEEAAEARKRLAETQRNTAISNTASTFGAIASILEDGNKKQFERSKKFALADAAISMYQGIAAGLKLGWPMAIPAVAYAAANGVAQIQNIKSQSFSGGGSVSSSGGGGVSAAPTATAAPQRNITLSGITPDQFVQSGTLINALNKELADGGNLNIEFA